MILVTAMSAFFITRRIYRVCKTFIYTFQIRAHSYNYTNYILFVTPIFSMQLRCSNTIRIQFVYYSYVYTKTILLYTNMIRIPYFFKQMERIRFAWHTFQLLNVQCKKCERTYKYTSSIQKEYIYVNYHNILIVYFICSMRYVYDVYIYTL